MLLLKFFFGTFRGIEVTYLYDQFVKRLINIILIFYFLSIGVSNIRCLALIVFQTILYLMHKLTNKRLEYMTTTRDRSIISYLKIGTLLGFLFLIDLSSINMLFDEKVIEAKEDLDVYSILNLITVLEICSMLMYLMFYIVKYFTNIIEIVTKYEFENKDTFYKAIALM